MVFLQLKDPLELFVKSREFLPGFLSRRDMTLAVESDVKPNSFLPFLWGSILTFITLFLSGNSITNCIKIVLTNLYFR